MTLIQKIDNMKHRSKMEKITPNIVALFAKIGSKLLMIGIKFAKFLKIGKFALIAGSAVSYAYLFTWQFSLMIMISLFVHEYGHLWAMKRCGLKTKGIYFIPFLGAASVADGTFKTRRDEAYIAIMGPIWGFILAAIVAIIYVITKNTLYAAAAGWMATINLFNLLPINPLDGGRILKSITFSINSTLGFTFLIIGIFASIIITLWAGIILFVFLLFIASLELTFEYHTRNEGFIIKDCLRSLDQFTGRDLPGPMANAVNDIKGIFLNEKEEPSARIEKVISLGKGQSSAKDTEESLHARLLSNVLSHRLDRYNPMPKMTIKGTIISTVAYTMIAVILWMLTTYMNHVPEVEIARKFFMSYININTVDI